jgi:predicted O-methyltransferase YrrM
MTSDGPAVTGWTDRDLHAWPILRPLLDAGGYLPWSEGAMRPAGLVELCNEIVLAPRRRVLELGSGVSTIVLGRLLRTTGGTLVAVEHDATWCTWVAERLRDEGLETTATVHHAPLEARDGHALPWYAERGVDAALAAGAPDLLVVDGPPAFRPQDALARLPALAELLARLAPDATIVLDDIARAGEREVLERWEEQSELAFERRPDTGLAWARRARC